MARRDSKIVVDLFPFLSVLCCMIGVMLLMITVILGTRVLDAEGIKPPPYPVRTGGPSGDGEEQVDEKTYAELEEQVDGLARRFRDRQRERHQLQEKVDQLQ